MTAPSSSWRAPLAMLLGALVMLAVSAFTDGAGSILAAIAAILLLGLGVILAAEL